MRKLKEIKNIKGVRVLVRIDCNVPLNKNKIRDTFRIEQALNTVKFLKKKGAIQILISHLGSDGSATLAPVAAYIKKKIPITFIKDEIGSESLKKKISKLQAGDIVLLENIRKYSGEEKNLAAFAKDLATLAEVYVNDAFSVSHRKHASIVGIPKLLPSYAGLQLEKEVAELGAVVKEPKKPLIFILGGAKFSTKIPLIKRYAEVADKVVVVGAILNNFYQAAGFEVGSSVVEKGYDKQIKEYLTEPNVLLPIDVVVIRGNKAITIAPSEVQKGDVIVDIGMETIKLLAPIIKEAQIVIWNGPLGWYEKGFVKATVALGKELAKTKAKVIVGGGDTVTVLGSAFTKKKNIFVSTGGGATIDFLAEGSIPGIDLL